MTVTTTVHTAEGEEMSKKYVIELEDDVFTNRDNPDDEDRCTLYRVKGFNSLVFDDNGVSRLSDLSKELDEVRAAAYHEGYKRGVSSIDNNVPKDSRNYYLEGLNKMWDIVRRILISKENGCENSVMPELKSIFNDIDNFQIRKIFMQLDPETVVARIDEYDGIQDPLLQKPEVIINVGDQVDLGDGNLGVVFSVDEEFIRGYFYPDSALQPVPFVLNKDSEIKLTGKKITGIETLINNMKKLP